MRKTKQGCYLLIFHILLFSVLFTSAVSVLFLPPVSQADSSSSEKFPEEISQEYIVMRLPTRDCRKNVPGRIVRRKGKCDTTNGT